MAWNPHPDVAVARDFGEKKKAEQVIILYIIDGNIGYASWGKTKKLCNDARNLADQIFKYLGVQS